MKKEQWFALFLTGILILVIMMPIEEKEEEKTDEEESRQQEVMTEDTYLESLESRTENMLRLIEGVGEAKVMITLKNDGMAQVEKDVAENSTGEDRSYEEETVYAQGGEEPFVISNDTPAVEGVLVVCDGGDSANVQQNVIDAVKALFSLESHKIKVVRRAGGQ